ncbi:putative Rhs domain protein [Rhodococcus sp. MTM3W5.2]|uniref:WXG100 family type VII secretion target n=1 Tax=Rhodococcus sp. MTM3W5.2 TaxID=1805827 RepID=UPI0009795742|nr:hypothetical protein [Rhodococcus sp. MTM3W5.2]AQA20951.1 putative Rhs domain protein [Rhodococcus sp. MTM3W5.2]
MSWLSDTWDDATGAIDSAGEFVEDAVESGIESLGQAADSGLDAASGVARRLGADGVADALTDLGDQVASLTGGAVDELELGQTEQPKELIRGEPAAIAEATSTLNELSSSISSTGDALRTVDAAGWTGTAADGFNAVYDKQPGLWHEAADAMSAAGRSLTSWSYTVEAAQARAAEAVELWRQAEREELAKKTAYAALSADAQAGTELVDSWSAMKDAARELLRGARIERDGVAGQVAGALSQATAAAPTEPPFTERMVANLADATDALEVAKTNFGSGLLTGLTGIVQFVRQVNPADQYNLTHPAEYGAAMSDLATGLFVAAADPGAVVSAMVDDALANPFEFAGSLTGDAILTAATAGPAAASRRRDRSSGWSMPLAISPGRGGSPIRSRMQACMCRRPRSARKVCRRSLHQNRPGQSRIRSIWKGPLHLLRTSKVRPRKCKIVSWRWRRGSVQIHRSIYPPTTSSTI